MLKKRINYLLARRLGFCRVNNVIEALEYLRDCNTKHSGNFAPITDKEWYRASRIVYGQETRS